MFTLVKSFFKFVFSISFSKYSILSGFSGWSSEILYFRKFSWNKIFVFDLDCTLADTAPALLNAGNHVLGSIGREPMQIEEYKEFIGGGGFTT